MENAVADMWRVGLSLAALPTQKNHASAVDIAIGKIAMLGTGMHPICGSDASNYLAGGGHLKMAPYVSAIYRAVDFVTVEIPADYGSKCHSFEARHVEGMAGLAPFKSRRDEVSINHWGDDLSNAVDKAHTRGSRWRG